MLSFRESLLCAVFVASSISAHAAPVLNINSSTGKLMGATGVKVGNGFYDVVFADGSCDSLMNNCTPFAFSSQSLALAAQALLDQVFVGQLDDKPYLINGCTWTGTCTVRLFGAVTYDASLKADVIASASATNNSIEASDVVRSGRPMLSNVRSYDTTDSMGGGTNRGYETNAIWSPSAAGSIPEPESLTLVGVALLGLAASRKTKKVNAA